MIEVLEGKVIAYKDDNGKNINKTAQKHMSMYRVRCPECQKNFCSQCKEQPYHIGKTCAQFKKDKEAKKCRFCGVSLRENSHSNICAKKNCKKEAKNCCKAFLDCDHPCYGYDGEKEHPSCLHEDCVAKDEKKTLEQNADSFCTICYV